MAMPLLTAWEEKERAGLLALETEQWREKRLLAEDPNTTGKVLEAFIHAIFTTYTSNDSAIKYSACLLAEAVVAHVNVPPRTLQSLLNLPAPWALFCPRGFCRNPIGPLLCLETPDFWERLAAVEYTSAEAVLREASAPTSAIVQLSKNAEEAVAESAQLHVSLAGELQTQHEGLRGLTDFWRAFCAKDGFYSTAEYKPSRGQHWHADIVELGLAPLWAVGEAARLATILPPPPIIPTFVDTSRINSDTLTKMERFSIAVYPKTLPDVLVQLAREAGDLNSAFVRRLVCRHPNAPPDIVFHARHGFVASAGRKLSMFNNFEYGPRADGNPPHNRAEFVQFVANLHGAFDHLAANLPGRSDHLTLYEMGQSAQWMARLNAALALPLTDTAFADDLWNRSPLQLMNHLARDGNRFVRWAAQTRLADPNFVFTWQDDE